MQRITGFTTVLLILASCTSDSESGDLSVGSKNVIRVADGEYRFDERLVAASSGTATSPITLRGSREAIIRTKN